jgi:hypothetical protein
MKKILLLITTFVVAMTMSGCTKGNESLEAVGLDGLSGKEILTGVADGSIVIDGFGLSVYDDELLVIIGDERVSINMPEDEFYLSVAPYIENTHSCTFHSATGCRGELKSESFFVEFIDANGNVIISENMTSLSNGFIDLWLPRDVEGTLTITQGNLSASKVISTEAGEPTCETTMHLT